MNQPHKRWQAIPGYIIDVFRLARARFSNPHSHLKFLHLKCVGVESGASTLVESGTYLGVTAYRCSFAFKTVYTIEIEPSLAASARKLLARRQNVEVICGDAVNELGRIFRAATFDRALVYLDGHFSGVLTGCGAVPEPALQELHVLSQFKTKIGAIVIDDFRNFGSNPKFPKKSELMRAAEDLFSEFEIVVNYDQVVIARRTNGCA